MNLQSSKTAGNILTPSKSGISQFFFFLASSGTAAAINFGSRIVFSLWLSFSTAIVLAYLVGMITAFNLNRLLVFKGATKKTHQQAMWFVAINLFAVMQTLIVSLLLAQHILPALDIKNHIELISHGIGVAFPLLSSYFGHKLLTFR